MAYLGLGRLKIMNYELRIENVLGYRSFFVSFYRSVTEKDPMGDFIVWID
jgi:hypothetical protein